MLVFQPNLLVFLMAFGDQSIGRNHIDDDKAFSEVYKTYWKPLFVRAYNKLKDVQEAEDLVSDLFFDLYKKGSLLNIHTSLEAYLSISLKHRLLDIFRARKIKEDYQNHLVENTQSFHHDVDNQLSFNELYSLWQHVANELPKQCRLIYKMSAEEGLSTRDIAKKLQISERTVESHRLKALKILRTKLTVLIILAILHASQ